MRVPTIASTADNSVSAASTAITAAMPAINPIVVTRRVRVRAARAGSAQNQLEHPVGGMGGHLLGDLTAHQIERRDSSASPSTSRSCTISGTVTGFRRRGARRCPTAVVEHQHPVVAEQLPDQQRIPVGYRTGAPHHQHQPQTVVPPVR